MIQGGEPRKSESIYDALFGLGSDVSRPVSNLQALASLGLGTVPTRETESRSGLTPLGSLSDDLKEVVRKIFQEQWTQRVGNVVPDVNDLALGNDASVLDATVLYADMADSTKLVDSHLPHFAAEVYKTYLACAARIIKNENGVITAYDGDRIMGVFIGVNKNTRAVRTALRINGAVWDIINPALKAQYPDVDYRLKHVIGVDTSKLFVSRIGVRNDNDLVWVGRAANYAAKLSGIDSQHTTYVTHSVYDAMHESMRYGGATKALMWQELQWTQMGNMRIYGSTWKIPM